MKQTSLDYFMQSLGITKTSKFEITDTDGSPKIIHVSEVYEQAKAMEKEQIIRAHLMARCYDTPNSYNEAEQYYNENYEKNI